MPKPCTKKKRFIDPKRERTTTFALIHRSQKDPLAADPDAPQRLLQPMLSKEEVKKKKDEEKKFGVFFDDEYDYLQHLKARELPDYDWDQVDRFLLGKDDEPEEQEQKKTNLKLPSTVFPSRQEEEEVGLLNKAAPSSGPLLDWDPDIVETLDDAYKHEVVYTLKDEEKEEDEDELDDIIISANDVVDDDDDDDEYEDFYSDEADDDVPSLENFSDEETKSKFTVYSMSSSVIRRNDQLTLLDDKLEHFIDAYDDEQVGGLECEDIEGHMDEESDVMKHMLKDFEKMRATERQNMNQVEKSDVLLDIKEEQDDEESDLEVKEVEEERRREDKLDCESIITTYSTLYNHPKLITEPSIKPIRVSGKTGIPKDILGRGLTANALKQLDRENRLYNSSSSSSDDDVETMTLASRVSQVSYRNKHESREEKKARKTAVKELRKERRVERKANRDAFKEEKVRQEKNVINNRSAVQTVKLN